jgi:hypothetical protein
MTDDERQELKDEILMADLLLKKRQGFWETPRNLVIIIGTFVAATAAIAGVLGYKIGQTPTTQQFILPPGTTIQIGPAPNPPSRAQSPN